jgi:tetratricopeptide (TPR) repeat protein
MALKKQVPEVNPNDAVITRAKDFWTKYQKPLMGASIVIILLAGGYLGYKYFIVAPKEQKAQDAIFKAEEYFRMDSIQKALNGDGLNPGFLTVMKKYGGTKNGKLAYFYAGVCYLRLGDYPQAVTHLKDFKTSSKLIQARAYKLLADAYSEQGKVDDAIANYKKAADHFPDDEEGSSEALYFGASFAEKSGKTKEAIDLFKELRDKYPGVWGEEANKHLAKLGVYN